MDPPHRELHPHLVQGLLPRQHVLVHASTSVPSWSNTNACIRHPLSAEPWPCVATVQHRRRAPRVSSSRKEAGSDRLLASELTWSRVKPQPLGVEIAQAPGREDQCSEHQAVPPK